MWEETTHKPFKAPAAKKLFCSMSVIGTTCLDECYLFCVATGKHYFSWKLIVKFKVFLNAMLLLSLKEVSWKMLISKHLNDYTYVINM